MTFTVKTVKIIKKFPSEDGSKWSKQLHIIEMGNDTTYKVLTYSRYYDDGFRGLVQLDKAAVEAIIENKDEILKELEN